MRSVFIHFPKSKEPVVCEWLTQHSVQSSDNLWFVGNLERPTLYCSLSDDYDDWELDELKELQAAITIPSAYVQADVSGHVPGGAEVRELTLGLLKAVPGSAAEDDYTSHLWTHQEVSTGALIEGHPFFGYYDWCSSNKG